VFHTEIGAATVDVPHRQEATMHENDLNERARARPRRTGCGPRPSCLRRGNARQAAIEAAEEEPAAIVLEARHRNRLCAFVTDIPINAIAGRAALAGTVRPARSR